MKFPIFVRIIGFLIVLILFTFSAYKADQWIVGNARVQEEKFFCADREEFI